MSRKHPTDIAVEKQKEEDAQLERDFLSGELLDSALDTHRSAEGAFSATDSVNGSAVAASGGDSFTGLANGVAAAAPAAVVPTSSRADDEPGNGLVTERTQALISSAMEIAQEALKYIDAAPGKQMQSVAERQKEEESFYFRYEKLHDEQEDVERTRKLLGVDRFDSNFLGIREAIQDDNPREFDNKQLGDYEAYGRVQHMLQNMFVRKPAEADSEENTNLLLSQLRQKLLETRSYMENSRKKARELAAALGVSTVECKAAQKLVSERNDEVNRLRNTVNVLQIQVRNFKRRQALLEAAGPAASLQPSREEMVREMDRLQQEYSDLCDANAMLEKENRQLRVRNELRPPPTIEPEQEKFVERRPERKFSADNKNAPTAATRAIMAGIELRRLACRRFESQEASTMALCDFDAGYEPPQSPAASPTPPPTDRKDPQSSAQKVVVDVGVNTIGEYVPAPLKMEPQATPQAPQVAVGAAAAAVLPAALSPRSKPREETSEGWKQSAKAWTALRKSVLANVVLSRAEALRREDAHVKRMRGQISQLTSELSTITASRDALQERVVRADHELERTKKLMMEQFSRAEEFEHKFANAEDKIHQLEMAKSNLMQSMIVYQADSVGPPAPDANKGPGRVGSTVSEKSSASEGAKSDRPSNVSKDQERPSIMTGRLSTTSGGTAHRLSTMTGGDFNYAALVAVLNDKIQRLEQEVAEKTTRITELSQIVGGGSTPATPEKVEIIEPFAEPAALKRLEKEVILKDQELITKDQDLKLMQAKLDAAEGQLTEERAVVALGLSRKAAARVISVLRRQLAKVRKTLADRRDQIAAFGDSLELPFAQTADHESNISGDRNFRRGLVVEEDMDEEELILRQLLTLTGNPLQRDLISRQINLLELEDRGTLITGRSIARREKDWFMMRRLWLRLLTLREGKWHEALTEEYRSKLAAHLTDTYEAFLRFEQNDSCESRPSMACNGAMRVVSQATSPIAQQTGIRSQDEIEREYVALVDLVKTRNTQLLQLEAERDELMATIAQLSDGVRTTKKEATLPSSLFIRHTVQPGDTPAAVGATFGITNFHLLHDAFLKAPRAAPPIIPDKMWIPLRTQAALTTAMEAAGATLIARHLVTASDTFASVAAHYSATRGDLRYPGSMKPIGMELSKDEAFACIDVVISKNVAAELLFMQQSPIPIVQWQSMVFAHIPTPKSTARSIAHVFNVSENEFALLNFALEEDATINVPLLLTRGTISMLPKFLHENRLVLSHTVTESDTLESIAMRSKVLVAELDPEELRPTGQMVVPITSKESLLALIRNPDVKSAVQQMIEAEESARTVPILRRKMSIFRSPVTDEPGETSTAAGDVPLIKLERSRTLTEAKKLLARRQSMNRLRRQSGSSPAEERSPTPGGSPKSPSSSLAPMPGAMPAETEFHVQQVTPLEEIAAHLDVLREELVVPNYLQFQGGYMNQWGVRLTSLEALRKAQESGYETFGIVLLRDESLEDLSRETSVNARSILDDNPELQDLLVSSKLSRWIRVPMMNLKAQSATIARSARVEAIIPVSAMSIEQICSNFAVDPSAIFPYRVDVDPAIASHVSVCRLPHPHDSAEHCLELHLYVDGLSTAGGRPDTLPRIRLAIEQDLWRFAEKVQLITNSGTLIGTQVCCVLSENIAIAHILVSEYALLDDLLKSIQSDEQFTPMASTHEILTKAGIKLSSALTLTCVKTVIFSFATTTASCKVIAVHSGDSLESIAIRFGIGSSELLAFNPNLMSIIYRVHPTDDAPVSLKNLTELTVPDKPRNRVVSVTPTDTLAGIAEKYSVTIEQLRLLNAHRLPLRNLVQSLRLPLLPVFPRPHMLVKAQTPESLLSWCTRFGISLETVDAGMLDVNPGTVLLVPSRAGLMSGSRFMLSADPQERTVDHGEKLEALADELGLLLEELIFLNPSKIRIAAGSTVCIPMGTTKEEKFQRRLQGLFVRHQVQPGDTLPTISANYFQPMTSVLAANPELYTTAGAHIVLVPLSGEDRHELFATGASNICTIIKLKPNDSAAGIAKRFQVPVEKINELTQVMNDDSHLIVPVISPVAISIARHQELDLYAVVQLYVGETFVTLADRYNVFVKDLIVLGKPLADLGVVTLDIPVTFDVAKKVQASPSSPASTPTSSHQSHVLLRTELLKTEKLVDVMKALGVKEDEIQLQDNSIEVSLKTQSALERARDRQTAKMSRRSALIDRTLTIEHALHQLRDRNDATHRELEKVQEIREQNRLLNLRVGRVHTVNMESIGVQTIDDPESEKKRATRRAIDMQTDMTQEYFEEVELRDSQAVQKIDELSHTLHQTLTNAEHVAARNKDLEKRVIELGLEIHQRKTDERAQQSRPVLVVMDQTTQQTEPGADTCAIAVGPSPQQVSLTPPRGSPAAFPLQDPTFLLPGIDLSLQPVEKDEAAVQTDRVIVSAYPPPSPIPTATVQTQTPYQPAPPSPALPQPAPQPPPKPAGPGPRSQAARTAADLHKISGQLTVLKRENIKRARMMRQSVGGLRKKLAEIKTLLLGGFHKLFSELTIGLTADRGFNSILRRAVENQRKIDEQWADARVVASVKAATADLVPSIENTVEKAALRRTKSVVEVTSPRKPATRKEKEEQKEEQKQREEKVTEFIRTTIAKVQTREMAIGTDQPAVSAVATSTAATVGMTTETETSMTPVPQQLSPKAPSVPSQLPSRRTPTPREVLVTAKEPPITTAAVAELPLQPARPAPARLPTSSSPPSKLSVLSLPPLQPSQPQIEVTPIATTPSRSPQPPSQPPVRAQSSPHQQSGDRIVVLPARTKPRPLSTQRLNLRTQNTEWEMLHGRRNLESPSARSATPPMGIRSFPAQRGLVDFTAEYESMSSRIAEIIEAERIRRMVAAIHLGGVSNIVDNLADRSVPMDETNRVKVKLIREQDRKLRQRESRVTINILARGIRIQNIAKKKETAAVASGRTAEADEDAAADEKIAQLWAKWKKRDDAELQEVQHQRLLNIQSMLHIYNIGTTAATPHWREFLPSYMRPHGAPQTPGRGRDFDFAYPQHPLTPQPAPARRRHLVKLRSIRPPGYFSDDSLLSSSSHFSAAFETLPNPWRASARPSK